MVAEPKITLAAGESREWYFFVRLPENSFEKTNQIKTKLILKDSRNVELSRELILLGPKVLHE
jgi:hypothetical protein